MRVILTIYMYVDGDAKGVDIKCQSYHDILGMNDTPSQTMDLNILKDPFITKCRLIIYH